MKTGRSTSQRKSDGYYISNEDLDAAGTIQKIRSAVGSKMDIMVELHTLWRFPAALKIAQALEEFDPFWYEDPIRIDSVAAVKDFADKTRVPVCVSETLAGPLGHRELLESGAASIVMPDLVWCGGITAGRRIAVMADTTTSGRAGTGRSLSWRRFICLSTHRTC